MRPKRYIAAAVALVFGLGSMTPVALSFEETTIGPGQGKSPTAQALETPETSKDLPKSATDPTKSDVEAGKGLKLTSPELQLSPGTGTEVKIPGIGSVGVLQLPKLDFGLELLYGSGEQKGAIPDKSSPDDVQLRGTIKHRF